VQAYVVKIQPAQGSRTTGYVRGSVGDQTCQRSPTRHTVLDGETLVLLVEDGPPEHVPAVG